MSPTAVRSRVEAPVIEVFASIQGEGLFVGEPQVFARLGGCPLRCTWCDTPGSWSVDRAEGVRIAAPTATRREPTWATPFQVACWVAEVEAGSPRTVSITGGEPLLWPEFVLGLRSVLGARRLHLETAGAHPEALARVIDAIDHVSVDLKLSSDLDAPVALEHAGGEPLPRTPEDWDRVRAAILRLLRGRDACAKLVVSGGHAPAEFEPLVLDLARLAPDVPLVLQPVTPLGRARAAERATLEALVALALEHELAVRVLPQLHRELGVR